MGLTQSLLGDRRETVQVLPVEQLTILDFSKAASRILSTTLLDEVFDGDRQILYEVIGDADRH